MVATLKIATIPYTFIEDTLDITGTVDERQRMQVDVIDYTGAVRFTKGMSVVLTDPLLGDRFVGVLNSVKETRPAYPDPTTLHTIDCIDWGQWVASKRTYTRVYDTGTYSGKIVVDHLHDVLAAEGIAQNYALHLDTTTADFNAGIRSGTTGYGTVGDGDLELTKAGSDVSIIESTTANFAAGTLTNMTAANNTLAPSTFNCLSIAGNLPFANTSGHFGLVIWTGSMVVGAGNDILRYGIWIADSSPAKIMYIDFLFSDGTFMASTANVIDQNNVLANGDLSNYAVDQWFTRAIGLSLFAGKTISKVIVSCGGPTQGTYTFYLKDIWLQSQSGNRFFSTTSTTTQTNPIQAFQVVGYLQSTIAASVLPAFDPVVSLRTSPSYSIDAVKLLKASTVIWAAGTPGGSGFTLQASYDGGTTYQQCTNNAALPAFPVGSNTAGLSIILQESFSAGNNPTVIPNLQEVDIVLASAPNATKSDIITTFATSTAWNTGTYNGTQTSSNTLALANTSRTWSDNLITNQTFFTTSGATQSASSNYRITMNTTGHDTFGASRIDFAGSIQDFILDVDFNITSGNQFQFQIAYRTTYWDPSGGVVALSAYNVVINSATVWLQKGGNASGGSNTVLAQITHSTDTSTHHCKISVIGSHHQVFFDNSTNATVDITDTSYIFAGQIGLAAYGFSGSGTNSITYSNLVINPDPIGTWTGPSTSISSLGTCGLSSIAWTTTNVVASRGTAATVQTSVDGGSTYQICTNGGAIPNLPSGTNVSGKSVIVLISLATISNQYMPVLQNLVWRVTGQFPATSGTRTTAPLGNDMSITRTVGSGWGTAFDSQTWTQVGTGTTAVASGEETITNTTGDVHMVLGSRTGTDEDGTVRFQLSAATISAGIELRYTDANNYYRLSASTTAISIIKRSQSVTTTLATVPAALATGIWYRMRFRVTGASVGSINLYGRVWLDGSLENQSSWTITASE